MFVLAMDVMSPPLNTEDCQEGRGAGDLSDNSAQECAAYESWHERDDCGNQWRANVAPRIFPVKHPSQCRVTQDALDDVGQKDTEGRTHRTEARNEPEQAARGNRARDRRMQ